MTGITYKTKTITHIMTYDYVPQELQRLRRRTIVQEGRSENKTDTLKRETYLCTLFTQNIPD